MKKEKKKEEKPKQTSKNNFLSKHKKGLIILGVILACAIGIGTFIAGQVKSVQGILTTQYATTTLEKRNIINSVSVNGLVASEQKKDVTIPLTNLEIKDLNVDVGDMVSKGDIIAVLDSTDIEENLAEARQSLKVASSQTYNSINSDSDGLTNTKETASINETRAQEDLEGAYMDYATAGASEATALTEYNSSLADTTTAKAAYDKAVIEVNAAQDTYDTVLNNQLGDDKMNLFEANLNAVKAADAVAPYVYAWNSVEITPELPTITAPTDGEMDTEEMLSNEAVVAWTEGSTDPTTAKENRTAIVDAIVVLRNSQIPKAEYDTAIATANVSSAQTVLTTAEATEATAKAIYETKKAISDQKKIAYDSAKATRETMTDLYNKASLSLDDTKRTNDTSISSQEDKVDNTKLTATTATTIQENQVETYEKQLEDCIIRAPFDGTITALNFEEGDTYSGITLYTIQNYEELTITASVDQYDISDIKKGMRAVFKTDTTGEEEMIGIITFVSPVPEVTTGMTTSTNYPIEITIDKPNERLRLGMTAQANIVLEEVQDVFAVPYECIKEDEDGESYINVIVEDLIVEENQIKSKNQTTMENEDLEIDNQNIKRIYVETGLKTDYYTEIVSKELEEGMVVQLAYLEETLLDSENAFSFKAGAGN